MKRCVHVLLAVAAFSMTATQAEAQENVGVASAPMITDNITIVEEQTEQSAETLFEKVEVMPQFAEIKKPDGTLLEGLAALQYFIINNLHYPVIAEENGIEGKIMCQFIVEKDGQISNVTVAKATHVWSNPKYRDALDAEQRKKMETSLDKEAVRLVKSMPKWYPGLQKEKPVRVRLTLPLNFKLQ